MKTEDIEQNYRKALILTGPMRSGKSRLSSIIQRGRETVIIDGRRGNVADIRHLCTEKTEVIVLDDWNLKKGALLTLEPFIKDGIHAGKGVGLVKVNPWIIITIDTDIHPLPKGREYDRLFDIFNLTDCN